MKMKLKYMFIIVIILGGCYQYKNILDKNCDFTTYITWKKDSSFIKKDNFDYSLTPFRFVIQDCLKEGKVNYFKGYINNSLKDYDTYNFLEQTIIDSSEFGLEGVGIYLCEEEKNNQFKIIKQIGNSHFGGVFKIALEENDLDKYLLLYKEGYNDEYIPLVHFGARVSE